MLSRFFPALPHFSLQQAVTFVLFVGIVSAGFFAAFVVPIVGPEKFQTALQNATDLNKIAQSIGQVIPIGPSEPTNPIPNGPYCGDSICDADENIDMCALDCFACNANNKCDSDIGENNNSCPVDCPVFAGTCNNDGLCDLRETTRSCPNDCPNNFITDDTNHPVPGVCGNNTIERTEACDGNALNANTCITQGFLGGTITCNTSCTGFVTAACTGAPAQTCGNNHREGTETCDGTDLNAQTCITKGYTSGSLSCNATCSAFVTSGCASTIGAVLVPGTGWTGAISQPAAVGNSSQPGFDAKAIARWDSVPYQMFDGNFNLGVVAFHMNGIDRVEFSVNNGPWAAVRQMTLNPQTNVKEYWVTLRASDFNDGLIEVRAIAYPTVGVPRVLQGSKLGGEMRLFDGVHSAWLYANRNGSLTPAEFHVKPSTGSDSNPGTAALPFATLPYAMGHVGNNGATIILDEAGEYNVDRTGLPGIPNERYITVRPAQGLSRENVVLMTPAGYAAQARPNVNRLHFYNVSVDFGRIGVYFSETWWDSVRFFNSRGWTDRQEGHYHGPPAYLTDTVWENMFSGFSGAEIVRNSTARHISGDIAQYGYFILNSTVDDFRNIDDWNWHSDVIQYQDSQDNLIIYGLNVTNTTAAQMWIFGIIREGDSIINSAFVDITLDYTPIQPVDTGLSQIAGTYNHLLFKNVVNKQEIRIRTDVIDPAWKKFNAKNMVFIGNGLHPNAYAKYVVQQDLPSGVTFYNARDNVSGATGSAGELVGWFRDGNTTPTPTGPIDSTPPVRSGASPSGILSSTTTSTTISLTTNENAACRYSATAGSVFESMTAFSTTGGTSHSVSMNGLAAGTAYSFYAKCQDGSGNTNTDDYSIAFTVGAPSDPSADPALVGHWSFDQTTVSGATAQDTSGNGYHATLMNSPTVVSGHAGEALQFNGTDQRIDLSYPGLDITGAVTISAWINPTVVSGNPHTIYTRGVWNAGHGLAIVNSTLRDNSGTQGGTPQINTWQHVAKTFDGTTTRLYLNGMEVASAATTTATSTASKSGIGAEYYTAPGRWLFSGMIDDVRVYSRALSQAEIQALANG